MTIKVRPQDHDLDKFRDRYSPLSILIITVISVILAEIVAMIVVYFFRHLPYTQQVLIDAAVVTIFVFPILYFLSFRPIIQHVRQRYQVEQVLQSRLFIIQYANTHILDDIMRFALDEVERLTESKAGYFHFVESDQNAILLQTWSTNTLQNICLMNGIEKHYSVDEAGVWADCIRQRKVVVHNDYQSLPNRRGLPKGHAPIDREMAVPIIREDKIVAVIGVGNKSRPYTSDDVELVSTLSDFIWDIIRHKQAADAERASEEKIRTVIDWTYDWEMWIGPDGNILYISPSCERITGYKPQEFSANPGLMTSIVHPDDHALYAEHLRITHDKASGVEDLELRLVVRNGEERWIEHICRPVFGENERFMGRRISNRDITLRKIAEREIEERNLKENLLTQTIRTMQLDIARDLHDTIGQNISFLRMKLDHLSSKTGWTKAILLNELETMKKAANESYDLIRGTLVVLQSGASPDLFNIFTRYAEQVEERSDVRIEFSLEGDARPISPKRMRQLFYIFREILTNIEKHAQAQHVSIKVGWGDESLDLEVCDDGVGFDPENIQFGGHYGLRFMRERVELLNGSLNIQSAAGAGTNLEVRVPYE